jgi:hypothetical protein
MYRQPSLPRMLDTISGHSRGDDGHCDQQEADRELDANWVVYIIGHRLRPFSR